MAGSDKLSPVGAGPGPHIRNDKLAQACAQVNADHATAAAASQQAARLWLAQQQALQDARGTAGGGIAMQQAAASDQLGHQHALQAASFPVLAQGAAIDSQHAIGACRERQARAEQMSAAQAAAGVVPPEQQAALQQQLQLLLMQTLAAQQQQQLENGGQVRHCTIEQLMQPRAVVCTAG